MAPLAAVSLKMSLAKLNAVLAYQAYGSRRDRRFGPMSAFVVEATGGVIPSNERWICLGRRKPPGAGDVLQFKHVNLTPEISCSKCCTTQSRLWPMESRTCARKKRW